MDNYIALLLFVMPGFVARKIYKQTNNIREDLSTFEETMYCLLNSALIIIMLSGYMDFPNSVKNLSAYFDDMQHIFIYGYSALFIACVLGLMTDYLLKKYNWAINKVRKIKGMAQLSISQDVLDEFLLVDGMNTTSADDIPLPRLIEIYKDGEMLARGWLEFSNMKNREFLLNECEFAFNKYIENNKKGPPIKRLYVDGRLGLTIKEYDLTILACGKQ